LNVLEICKSADIVFNALHGDEGENGKLQAAFDLLNICYTGSGAQGCMLAMNKSLSKQLFRTRNLNSCGKRNIPLAAPAAAKYCYLHFMLSSFQTQPICLQNRLLRRHENSAFPPPAAAVKESGSFFSYFFQKFLPPANYVL